MSDEHSIKLLCEALGVSRSGHYQRRRAGTSARARRSEAITRKIKAVHTTSRCIYGSPRVRAALRAQGERVGRNRVVRSINEAGIEGRQRRRYQVRTTDSRHDEPIAPDWLADASPLPGPTRSGWPTSPMSKPPRAGYTWPQYSISTAAS